VTELVLNNDTEEGHLRDRHVLRRAHYTVSVGDASNIFHSTILIIGAYYMVQLCKWISLSKILLVETHCCLGYAKYKFVIEIFSQ
jgi:hypothetical protein